MLSLRLAALGMAAVALWACGTPSTPTHAPTPVPSGARVTMGGETIDIAEGDVIRQMPRRPDGNCEEPPAYSVSFGGSIAWVDIYFDEDCALIVRDIGLAGEQRDDQWPTPTPSPTATPAHAPTPNPRTYCPGEWETYFSRLKAPIASYNVAYDVVLAQFYKVEDDPALVLDERWQDEALRRLRAFERAAMRQSAVMLSPGTLNPVDSINGEILRAELDGAGRLAAWIEGLDRDAAAAVEADPRAVVVLSPYFGDLVRLGGDLHMLYLRILPVGCFDAMIAAYG